MLGLALPGAGHFYTQRNLAGVVLLGIAAGAASAGLLYEEVEVTCLSVPRDGACPESDVVSRDTSRPFLVPALGVVGASAVLSAVSAYRGARARNDAVGRLGIVGLEGVQLGGGVRLLPPSVGPSGEGLALELVRLRF
jgi:hypothetical protein